MSLATTKVEERDWLHQLCGGGLTVMFEFVGWSQFLAITVTQQFPSTVGSQLPNWCWLTDRSVEQPSHSPLEQSEHCATHTEGWWRLQSSRGSCRLGARGYGQTYTWRFGMCVYRCRGGGESGAGGAEWRVTYGTIYKKGAYKSLQVDSSDIPPHPPETNKQTNPEHTLCGQFNMVTHIFFFSRYIFPSLWTTENMLFCKITWLLPHRQEWRLGTNIKCTNLNKTVSFIGVCHQVFFWFAFFTCGCQTADCEHIRLDTWRQPKHVICDHLWKNFSIGDRLEFLLTAPLRDTWLTSRFSVLLGFIYRDISF